MVIRVLEIGRPDRADVRNPLIDPAFVSDPPESDPLSVHQRMPGYQPSPLIELPMIAREFGAGAALAEGRVEPDGLPAFKILGASWAVVNAVQQRLGITADDWVDAR